MRFAPQMQADCGSPVNDYQLMYSQALHSYFVLSEQFKAITLQNDQLYQMILQNSLRRLTQKKQANAFQSQLKSHLYPNEKKSASMRFNSNQKPHSDLRRNTFSPDHQYRNQLSNSSNQKDEKTSRHRSKDRKRKKHSGKPSNFKCSYPNCRKKYGTSASLNLHIKLKHNGGTPIQRQAYAVQSLNIEKKLIIQAEQKGLPTPIPSIELPPRFLQVSLYRSQDYRREMH